MIDQDPPHLPGRDSKEVGAILPRDVHLDELDERFVDNRRGLKRVPWPLLSHVLARAVAQLFVDERRKPFQRARIPGLPRGEEPRDGLPIGRGDRGCDRVAQGKSPNI